MWENGALSAKRKFGILGDLFNVVKAVAGISTISY